MVSVRQLTLPSTPVAVGIVNVACVAQLSPFRYPGGKTWLVPHIRQWLTSRERTADEFVEPFAGGAIVGLTVAAEGLARHVTLMEIDAEVVAVWQTIFDGDVEWLANRLATFELTTDAVQEVLSQTEGNLRDRAFRALLKNRVSHGGIMAPGAGLMKNGENGKGITSRWYAGTLRKRILRLAALRDKVSFVAGDGVEYVRQSLDRKEAVFFMDPPYTARGEGKRAGRRLYTHFEIDHDELFELASRLKGDFLMTYDNCGAVREMARRYGFDTELVAMKNTHHARMTELLIGRDLRWAKSSYTPLALS